MQKGNYTQARADVNKSLQLNPNYQEAKDLDAELKKKGY
jgi:Tfp pilus assembly protein PilF